MAREESSRENLLGEATALVERIELRRQGSDEHVVAGFRRDGALSVFFGEDPVYQFNAAGELRRAYCDGLLFKAVRGRLVSLNRVRQQDQVQLVRHDLSEAEQSAFLARMAERMRQLAELLATNSFEVVGQVPADADVLSRVREWFAERREWQVAARANA